MATMMNKSDRGHDPDKVRAGVWRTVWICIAVVAVLVGVFWTQHLW